MGKIPGRKELELVMFLRMMELGMRLRSLLCH